MKLCIHYKLFNSFRNHRKLTTIANIMNFRVIQKQIDNNTKNKINVILKRKIDAMKYRENKIVDKNVEISSHLIDTIFLSHKLFHNY